jgi:tryptophanyl-tRNA synthetase
VEPNAAKPDYIENIFLLMKLVCKTDVIEKYETDYNNCSIRYGDLKKQLAEDMVAFIAPIRSQANELLHNEKLLGQIMEHGAAKAQKSAAATMQLVRDAIGLNYY